jgi:drug/metabolite transporter superfamily protein YnfA
MVLALMAQKNNRPDGLVRAVFALLAEREREFGTRRAAYGWAFVSFSVACLWQRPKSTSGFE